MAIVTVFNQYETSLWISSPGRIFCIFEMEYFYDVSFPDWKYSRRHVEMTKTRFRKFSFKNEHKIQNKSRLLLLLAYNQCNFIFSTTICPYFCYCMVKYFYGPADGDIHLFFSARAVLTVFPLIGVGFLSMVVRLFNDYKEKCRIVSKQEIGKYNLVNAWL